MSKTAESLDQLWEPVEIGAVTARNRIAVSAHQTHFPMESNDLIGDRYIAYLEARARGGAGLLVMEAGAVHPSAIRHGLIDIYREEAIPGMRSLGEAVHGHGAVIFAQLSHMGDQDTGTSVLDHWHPLLAPSPIPSVVYGRMPKAMERSDIDSVVAGYGQTAANVSQAGIDGAEISAGHGYLMCQFLSPLTNRRDDEYGGGTENRCRFPIEAATEIRRRVGPGFALGIRLSFDEYVGEAGITKEIGEETIRVLDATGLFDYFSITAGNYHSNREWVPTMTSGYSGNLAEDAGRARAAIGSGVPVMVASAIRTVQRAAEIVRAGQADLIAMARAHIADPDLVNKARSGRWGEIRRCVGANQGCFRRLFEHGMITCTVNPAAGRERTLDELDPAVDPRRVLVVGGGPAGMTLAETAARCGHDVILIERSRRLGGQLLLAGKLPNRGNWIEMADDLAAACARNGVDVRLETDADADLIGSYGADRVFLATGSSFDRTGFSISSPNRDRIPGADGENVLDPAAAIADPERCGDSVVIVDDNGDHLPLGLALLLAAGRRVEVVTSQLFAGSRLTVTGDIPWLQPALSEAGVALTNAATVDRIEPGAVTISSIWGGSERTIPADTVILSMMRLSNDSLQRELASAGVEATPIGDCLAPREVDDATFEGLAHGRRIAPNTGQPLR